MHIWGAFWSTLASKSEKCRSERQLKKRPEKHVKKVTRATQESPPVVPLKEFQEWQMANLQVIRDTPLVPRGHGGG